MCACSVIGSSGSSARWPPSARSASGSPQHDGRGRARPSLRGSRRGHWGAGPARVRGPRSQQVEGEQAPRARRSGMSSQRRRLARQLESELTLLGTAGACAAAAPSGVAPGLLLHLGCAALRETLPATVAPGRRSGRSMPHATGLTSMNGRFRPARPVHVFELGPSSRPSTRHEVARWPTTKASRQPRHRLRRERAERLHGDAAPRLFDLAGRPARVEKGGLGSGSEPPSMNSPASRDGPAREDS